MHSLTFVRARYVLLCPLVAIQFVIRILCTVIRIPRKSTALQTSHACVGEFLETHTHARTREYTHRHTHTRTHTQPHTHMCKRTPSHTHTHSHTYTHAHRHTGKHPPHFVTCMCTHAHTHHAHHYHPTHYTYCTHPRSDCYQREAYLRCFLLSDVSSYSIT